MVWFVLAAAVFSLALIVRAHPPQRIDILITQELQEPRAIEAALGAVLTAVSVPGNAPYSLVLVVTALLGAVVSGGRRDAALIAWSLVADVVTVIIKAVVARARPTTDLVEVFQQLSDPSFPSVHVVHYVVFFGAIAYLAYAHPSSRRSPWLAVRVFLACVSLSLIG